MSGQKAGVLRGAVALRFGNCNNGANDGLRALNVNNAASNANWNIGASFIYPIMEHRHKVSFLPTPLAVEILLYPRLIVR